MPASDVPINIKSQSAPNSGIVINEEMAVLAENDDESESAPNSGIVINLYLELERPKTK